MVAAHQRAESTGRSRAFLSYLLLMLLICCLYAAHLLLFTLFLGGAGGCCHAPACTPKGAHTLPQT